MNQSTVSVVTPVYNGEAYLAECIESVLAQDYQDFEYTILNNCSTDRTLEVAESYARQDPRIQVRTNTTFVSAIENFNLAFSLVGPHRRYCKAVSADDWIMPTCISKMVALAEANPTVGIVGCYQRSGNEVKWRGLPATVSVMSGRDAARLGLLEEVHVLGASTSVLYRSDLLRIRNGFYPRQRSHADASACYESFKHCDFGFVHEVLSAERVHAGQWSAEMNALDAGSAGYLEILLQYGPLYLSTEEFTARRKEVFEAYYRGLGGCFLKLKGRNFWSFHRSRLSEMGCELEWGRVIKAAIHEAAIEAKNPLPAMRKVRSVVREKLFSMTHPGSDDRY